MRGTIDDLPSPHPIGLRLPALFQEDDLAQRFVAGCDTVLAPIFLTLDNLAAHLDPRHAPADLLGWLAGWLGIEVDETWSTERLRSFVADAAGIFRQTGTAAGLQALLTATSGIDVEVTDSGGTVASAAPGGTAPGTDAMEVVVRVRAPKASVDAARLEALVAEAVPAHVRWRVEVRAR